MRAGDGLGSSAVWWEGRGLAVVAASAARLNDSSAAGHLPGVSALDVVLPCPYVLSSKRTCSTAGRLSCRPLAPHPRSRLSADQPPYNNNLNSNLYSLLRGVGMLSGPMLVSGRSSGLGGGLGGRRGQGGRKAASSGRQYNIKIKESFEPKQRRIMKVRLV